MKKMTKRIIALAAVFALVATGLTGCNKKTDSKTLVIGGIGPLTGAAATYGTAVKKGADLAVKEINAAGGISGMKLELKYEDDEHDAEKAVNAYNTLKDAGMKLLMGTVTSKPCIAVAQKTKDDNMFQLTPSGSAIDCTKYDNAFRVCFNDPNQGIASAQYIFDKKLATKVGVIYDSSDVYSSGIYAKFNAEATTKGLNVVKSAVQAFTGESNTDFSVQIQKIQESGVDLVFLPIYYKEAALILKQASKVGLKVKFFGCDGLDGIIDQLGTDKALANGVMLLTPFAADATDTTTQTFVSAFKAAYSNEIPNQFAADGYDAIYTIKAALEKAGVTESTISVSDLCNKLKVAMTQITVPGVTGSMTWAANGEPSKTPNAIVIKDGAYKAM